MFNVNTKVSKIKMGEPSELCKKTNGQIALENAAYRQFKKDSAQNENAKVVNETYVKNMQMQDSTLNKVLIQNRKNVVTEAYYKECPEMVLKEYFTKLYNESLVLDRDYVEEQYNVIRFLAHGYIKKLGGMKYLKEQAEVMNSGYLRNLYSICLESGKKIAHKKIAKAKNAKSLDELKIDFSINDEDKEEMDKNFDNLDVEELADKVKSKVIQVVKDENQFSVDENQFLSDLNEQLSGLDGDVDNKEEGNEEEEGRDYGTDDEGTGDTIKENLNSYFVDGPANKERSLFRSIMQKTQCDEKRGPVTESNYSPAGVDANIRNSPVNMNIYDIYLQDGNSDLSYIDFLKNTDEVGLAGDDTGIDTEQLLAESVGVYTMLECAYTIKLISPKYDEIKRVINYNLKEHK